MANYSNRKVGHLQRHNHVANVDFDPQKNNDARAIHSCNTLEVITHLSKVQVQTQLGVPSVLNEFRRRTAVPLHEMVNAAMTNGTSNFVLNALDGTKIPWNTVLHILGRQLGFLALLDHGTHGWIINWLAS